MSDSYSRVVDNNPGAPSLRVLESSSTGCSDVFVCGGKEGSVYSTYDHIEGEGAGGKGDTHRILIGNCSSV